MKHAVVLTTLLLGSGLLVLNTSSPSSKTGMKRVSKRFNAGESPAGNVSIIIDKSDYELSIYDDKGWYATYPVVFGNNSLGDKKMQGDKQTPEGNFHILNKRVHDKWCRYMALDYPTKESFEKFIARKERGEIPSKASIGGG